MTLRKNKLALNILNCYLFSVFLYLNYDPYLYIVIKCKLIYLPTMPIPNIADSGIDMLYIHRQPATVFCNSYPPKYPNKIPTTINASFMLIKVPKLLGKWNLSSNYSLFILFEIYAHVAYFVQIFQVLLYAKVYLHRWSFGRSLLV